uniref:Uncharacterized protein n=1 Tax=Musca domestica TaxID=7370 RepID=A0A1I8NGS4_MUSDO
MNKFYCICVHLFLLACQLMVNAEIFDSSSDLDYSNQSSSNDSVAECSINSLYSWQCNNGQCIHIEELCDGVIHCEDKSDETMEHCLDSTCPDYAFKCAYGGCISGNDRCNGVRNCIDGSDELRYLCDSSSDLFQDLRGSCWTTYPSIPPSEQIAILVVENYFLFSSRVKPVCLPSLENHPLLLSEPHLNVGRGVIRDTSREYLEFLISRMEGSSFGSQQINTSIEYIRIEKFIPFIKKEIKRYDTIFAYGGCISGNDRCNGVRNCIDGSDEIRYLCDSSSDLFQDLRGSCWLFSHMQCKSGECISRDTMCDGIADCKDGSDETMEICSIFDCPDYTFRCGYGACVPGIARCNGIKDCLDGSDEIPSHCGVSALNATESQNGTKITMPGTRRPDYVTSRIPIYTQAPPIQESGVTSRGTPPTTSRPFFVPSTPTQTSPTPSRPVFMPSRPTQTSTTTSRPFFVPSTPTQTSPTPSRPVFMPSRPTQTSTTTSRPFFVPSTPTQTSRLPTSTMRPSFAGPARFCTPNSVVSGISTVASCSYNNTPVSCYHNAPIGTEAKIFCSPGYMRKRLNLIDSMTMYCNFDGVWNRPKFRCIPRCGVLSEEEKRNPIKPWDVTVFRRSYSTLYLPICSGVIVSAKIVLSASNCLLSGDGVYTTDHLVYNVVEGYYNNVYREGETTTYPSIPPTEQIAILVVENYFLFSSRVKPVCLPSLENHPLLLSEPHLNVGRGVIRDTSREYLEFLISRMEGSSFGSQQINTSIEYIRIEKFIPFIKKEIKRYDTIL